MQRIRQIVFVLALLASTALADPVDDYIAEEIQRHQIPGVSLGVIQSGKITKAQGYGFANLEWRVPVTAATVFEIGSVTKQFTAVCVMMLVEQGKLKLDESIGKYLEVPDAWKPITLRHLLAHTSGLKTYNDLPGFEASRHLQPKQFIDKIAAHPLAFTPGESFAYCNTGYNLLGFTIEKVSGEPYWQFLSGHLLQPLGMTNTQSREPRAIIPNRAAGYEKQDGKLVNRDSDLTDVFAAGAIVSTVLDLAKWNAAIDSGKLLSASSWNELWTPFVLKDGKPSSYGLGWRVEPYKGRKNIGHGGSTSGFSASLQKYPDARLTVIVLCNSGEQNVATGLARGIADLLFASGENR